MPEVAQVGRGEIQEAGPHGVVRRATEKGDRDRAAFYPHPSTDSGESCLRQRKASF